MPDDATDAPEQFAAATIVETSRLGDPAASGWDGPGLSERGALCLPAYYSGVRFLSETLSTLPIRVLRRSDDGRESAAKHPVQKLLSDEPSELATPAVLLETLWHHTITWGNGYLLIDRDSGGRPIALYNLPPDRVEPLRVRGKTWYAVLPEDGSTPSPISGNNVIHVAGLGFDGLRGYSPIRLMADSLGLGKSAQQWATKFYNSGAHLGGVISTDAKLTPEQLEDVRREINSRHTGLANAAKWMVLMGGAKAAPLGAPPETAKLVEVLGVSVGQIAQILRVPPIHLYDFGRATWGNASEMDRYTVQYSLRPWIVKIEQELRRKLFTRGERESGLYVRVSVDGLLRGDPQARAEGARLRLSEGLSSTNEERRLEDRPPIDAPWADAYRVPANSIPATRLIDAAPPAPPLTTGDADPRPTPPPTVP